MCLFSIKCKGAVCKKSTVMQLFCLLFLFHSAFQKVIIAFLHTSITLDYDVHVRAPSLMATIIYDSIEFNFLFYLPLAGEAFQ